MNQLFKSDQSRYNFSTAVVALTGFNQFKIKSVKSKSFGTGDFYIQTFVIKNVNVEHFFSNLVHCARSWYSSALFPFFDGNRNVGGALVVIRKAKDILIFRLGSLFS